MPFYTASQRTLQDRFETRRLADAQEKAIVHDAFTDDDIAFIESRDMLFLSTIDARGQPTVSYKGGAAGFVRIEDGELAMPCYDGNGMFLSMGNVGDEARVGLLFVDFERPRRLRLHGLARLEEAREGDPPGSLMTMRVRPAEIFVNCPRYVHTYRKLETSRYVPRPDGSAPLAQWKRLGFLKDDLPARDRRAVEAQGTIGQEEYDAAVEKGRG